MMEGATTQETFEEGTLGLQDVTLIPEKLNTATFLPIKAMLLEVSHQITTSNIPNLALPTRGVQVEQEPKALI
jgi:hypothetical protein